MTILADGEVTLDEGAEPCLELDGAHLPVAKELALDGDPSVPSGATLGGGNLS